MSEKTDSEHVRDFNIAAGQDAPNTCQKMTKDEVHFLIKMMIDEMCELYATVAGSEDYKKDMIKIIEEAKPIDLDYKNMDDVSIIAEQADGLCDIYYYGLNAFVKKGVNISSIFHLVHESNMSKRDPETGVFLKRADGKIIKPASYVECDVEKEIHRQIKEGSFENVEIAEGSEDTEDTKTTDT